MDLPDDPMAAVADWLADAEGTRSNENAMTLATATPDGIPSARVVLLRGLDERGLVFFTNRASRKGLELAENPRAALVLHWWELGRQVRVEGTVEEVAEAESVEYWRTRPRPSQVAAWASPQSQAISGREELDELYGRAEAQFADGDVPLPDFWGGYRVVPTTVELWTHRENRLHDRIRYTRTPAGWLRERLAP